MRRPSATDFLSAALSVVLWVFGYLLIVTGIHITSAKAEGWIPEVTDCEIYFVVALTMHLIFMRRTATVRGWRFWLMPIVTVPLAAMLVFVLQLIAAEQAGQHVYVFGQSLYHRPVMLPCIFVLMYPFLVVHQFLVRVLYRGAVGERPVQVN